MSATGVCRTILDVYELNSDKIIVDESKSFNVSIFTNQTIFDLKTNIGILLSQEGYRIDDEKGGYRKESIFPFLCKI